MWERTSLFAKVRSTLLYTEIAPYLCLILRYMFDVDILRQDSSILKFRTQAMRILAIKTCILTVQRYGIVLLAFLVRKIMK